MEVGEGLRNPSLSHSAGADGLHAPGCTPTPMARSEGPSPCCARATSAPRGASKNTPSGTFKSKALGAAVGQCAMGEFAKSYIVTGIRSKATLCAEERLAPYIQATL